jgi:hypothetical protein
VKPFCNVLMDTPLYCFVKTALQRGLPLDATCVPSPAML